LTWQDFERLILRLVRRSGDVEHCQLYGSTGQAQDGIDLYVRSAGPVYSVYQAKRVKKFDQRGIKDAVDTFLAGSWANRAKTFTICTSHSGVRRQCAEAIEKQAARLKSNHVTLVVWDKDEISRQLKEAPELVDDFFSREWVRLFLGDEIAAAFHKRFDATKLRQLRGQLQLFLGNLFQLHDPGIPIPSIPGVSGIPLEARYVLPDIVAHAALLQPSVLSSKDSNQDNAESPRRDGRNDIASTNFDRPLREARPTQSVREPIVSWLARSRCSIIVGGPGSGKSSFLRLLALGLLAKEPTLGAAARHFADMLPIWVPFRYWTTLVSESGTQSCGLEECLQRWLERYGKAELWPLVKTALTDRRLLLLVDGLDEWTSEIAAIVATQMLQMFVEQSGVSAVVTTRPLGLRRVTIQGEDWQVGSLAELSYDQRRELCEKWFQWRERRDAAANLSARAGPS